MDKELKYRDEDDRCYGATGMAIGIVVFDGENLLSSISLDNNPSEMVELKDDFFFSGNPGLSAKLAWQQIVNNFNLSMAMTISNVMCRSFVYNGMPVAPGTKKLLHDCIVDEGTGSCSLEEDEVNRLFNKNYDYLYRIFNHSGVQEIARDFASHLKTHRILSRLEVLERLRALSML